MGLSVEIPNLIWGLASTSHWPGGSKAAAVGRTVGTVSGFLEGVGFLAAGRPPRLRSDQAISEGTGTCMLGTWRNLHCQDLCLVSSCSPSVQLGKTWDARFTMRQKSGHLLVISESQKTSVSAVCHCLAALVANGPFPDLISTMSAL